MNVMNGFVTSSTLAAAVDVNDLHTRDGCARRVFCCP